jgi:hypothetical protein
MNLARMSVHSASGSIPGIIDTNGTYVEHPHLVAHRATADSGSGLLRSSLR